MHLDTVFAFIFEARERIPGELGHLLPVGVHLPPRGVRLRPGSPERTAEQRELGEPF